MTAAGLSELACRAAEEGRGEEKTTSEAEEDDEPRAATV